MMQGVGDDSGNRFTFQPSEMAKLGIIMYCARAIAFEQTEECCIACVMANDVSGAGAVLDFYGEFLDIGVAGQGLFGDVVCRSFILEDVTRKLIGVIVGLMILMLAVVFIVPEKHLKSAGRLLTVKSRIETFLNPSETDSDGHTSRIKRRLPWQRRIDRTGTGKMACSGISCLTRIRIYIAIIVGGIRTGRGRDRDVALPDYFCTGLG